MAANSCARFLTLLIIWLITLPGVICQGHVLHHHVHGRHFAERVDMVKHAKELANQGNVVFTLLGNPVSVPEVLEGIRNGSLTLHKPSPPPVPFIPVLPTGKPLVLISGSPAVVVPNYTPEAAPGLAKPLAAVGSSTQDSCWPISTDAVDSTFPDNEIDCSVFPSAYGAIFIDWLELDGWIGIQNPQTEGPNGFSNIETMIPSLCSGSTCCGEGMFCSYACPVGYQKSQWPSMQGSTGQTVGGLFCQNGKLRLTNPQLSLSLCMKGSTAIPVSVQNTLSEDVAVCRTDYPGTEGETIPLLAAPNSVTNLTCPDATNYFLWEGKFTSAQYYVNPAGVSVADACQWGSTNNPWGNFAPLNLGVGFSNGKAWLSIFQNLPTTSVKLDFCVEIIGTNGSFDNLAGRCKYENGVYYSGTDYELQNADGQEGCTVSVSYGSATFRFY